MGEKETMPKSDKQKSNNHLKMTSLMAFVWGEVRA